MKNSLIAVDSNLKNIQEFLADKGYHVVRFDPDVASVAAIVVADGNYHNIQDSHLVAPILDARHKSPEEILRDIQKYVA